MNNFKSKLLVTCLIVALFFTVTGTAFAKTDCTGKADDSCMTFPVGEEHGGDCLGWIYFAVKLHRDGSTQEVGEVTCSDCDFSEWI